MFRSLFLGLLATTVVWGSVLFSDEAPKIIILEGNIGNHFSFEVGGTDGNDKKVIFNNVTQADFDTGYIEVERAIEFAGINSNYPVLLRLENKGWSLPPGYDSTNGSKKPDGSGEDLKMMVDVASVGADAGDLSAVGSLANTYATISSSPVDILQVGTSNQGVLTGVLNGSANVHARINLNSIYDIAGTYQVGLEITIASQ